MCVTLNIGSAGRSATITVPGLRDTDASTDDVVEILKVESVTKNDGTRILVEAVVELAAGIDEDSDEVCGSISDCTEVEFLATSWKEVEVKTGSREEDVIEVTGRDKVVFPRTALEYIELIGTVTAEAEETAIVVKLFPKTFFVVVASNVDDASEVRFNGKCGLNDEATIEMLEVIDDTDMPETVEVVDAVTAGPEMTVLLNSSVELT